MEGRDETYQALKLTYEFRNFFHPFVGELLDELNRASLNGMPTRKFLPRHSFATTSSRIRKLPGNTVRVRSRSKEVIDLTKRALTAN